MTVSTIANWESIPKRKSIAKNNILHKIDNGICERPSGMTMNAKPMS